MKSIILSSVVMALLAFSGCSSNEPAVGTKSTSVETPAEEVKAVETETVASDDSMVDSSSNSSSNAAGLSIAEVESKLSSIYFDFDKFELDNAMQEKVSAAAELGNTGAKAYSVKLEGNCDEWGSDEYNFALGLKRASAVKKALIAEGIEVEGNKIDLKLYLWNP